MKTIHIGGRKNVIPETVILFEADINYTRLYLNTGEKLFVATTLKELEARFANEINFFRLNKSYLINLNFMKKYDLKKSEILMENQKKVLISRRRKSRFLTQMNQND